MSERAAMYARVSSARQEHEQTIDSQIAALDRAATTLGLTIAKEHRYIDNGYSGTRLDRPAFDAMRDAAADGLIDVVLIYCPDRLARNYVHQQVILEELTKRGVRVHFVEHPIGERPEDLLLVQMQGVIAEYERSKLLERTRRGRIHKVRTGQVLPFTEAPFGYAILRTPGNVGGTVVVNEVEAQLVRQMYRWVLEDGLSSRTVAKRLNEQLIKPRRSDRWRASATYKILTWPAYAGTASFGRRESVEPIRPKQPGGYRQRAKSSYRQRPKEQWIIVPIPPLVDEAMQQAVRAKLAKNESWSPRNTHREYLLRTMVVCGECGLRMKTACRRHKSGDLRRDITYYRCAHAGPEHLSRPVPCTGQNVHSDELDAAVWKALTDWLKNPRMLIEEVSAWRESRHGVDALELEQGRIEATCRNLQAQINRLVDAYQEGALPVAELKARRERLEALLDAARVRAEELAAQAQDRTRIDRVGQELEAFAATVSKGLESLDFAGKQKLVRLVVERVVVRGDDITIEHVVPLSGRFSGLRPSHLDASWTGAGAATGGANPGRAQTGGTE